jgi:hypothetical protein
MARLSLKTAQALAKLIDSIPQPQSGDLAKLRVAVTHCKSLKDFCDFLELEPVVFKYWIDNYPQYKREYLRWRDHATSEIESALAKRAVGFSKKTTKDILTKTGQIVTLETNTYYPPDPTAAQFWLKNRASTDWKEAATIDVNVNANIRAWLVDAARASLDPSEIIDVTPNVINDGESTLIETETTMIESPLNVEGFEPLNVNGDSAFNNNDEWSLNNNDEMLFNIEAEEARVEVSTPNTIASVAGSDPLAVLTARWARK